MACTFGRTERKSTGKTCPPPKKKPSAGCTQASSPKRRTLLSRDATNLPADLNASLRPVLFRLRSSQRLSRRVAQERHAWVRREADSQGKRGDRAAGGGVAAGRVRWGRHGVLEVCLQEEGHGGRRCRAGGQKIEATGRGRRKVWREEVFRTLLSPLEYIFPFFCLVPRVQCLTLSLLSRPRIALIALIEQPLSHDKKLFCKKGGNFGRKFLQIPFWRETRHTRGTAARQKREGAANGARTGKLREREREK